MNFHHRLLRMLTVTLYSLMIFSVGIALLPLTDVAAAGGSGRLISASSPSNGPLAIPARVTLASISAGNSFACGVRNDGTLACWGKDTLGPLVPPTGTFIQVSASLAGGHACAVRTDGTVACWGDNTSGQTNVPTSDPFIQVSAGSNFTCGVKTDGTLLCWGADTNNQTTPPTGTFTQVSLGLNHACAIKSDGTLACWGLDEPPFYLVSGVPGGTFTQISAGSDFNCALKSDSTLLCWGNNANGQTNAPTGTFIQVSAGITHSCALSSDGTAVCWGGPNNDPKITAPSGTFTQVSAGSNITWGVNTDGSLSWWGTNTFPLPDGRFTRRFVSSGHSHSCTLRTDGTLDCWGDDTYLQAAPPPDTFLQVTSGGAHTCGLKSDGTLTCWGYNGNNQTEAPHGIFTQVSAGDSHTCALKVDGTIACWGDDENGQLEGIPSGTFMQVSAGNYHTCALKNDSTLACWGFSSPQDPITPPTGTFTQVSAGGWHTCAIATSGTVSCWGWDDYNNGQLNPPDDIFTQISSGYDFTCGVRPSGAVECWGNNDYGQRTDIPSGAFSQISAGAEHICGVKDNGILFCWGKNDDGQAPVPSIYPTILQDGVQNTAYNQTLSGVNGAEPYTFSIVAGSLPHGPPLHPLVLSSSGEITGTPDTLGTSNFTIQMTDANNFVIQRAFSLVVGTRIVPTMVVQLHDDNGDQVISNGSEVKSVQVGTSVHDKATLSGANGIPGGKVTFTSYASKNCTGVGTPASTIVLVQGVAHPSLSAFVTGAGLAFTASYLGNSRYIAVTGPCQVLEPIILSPTIVTHIHDPLDNPVTEAPAGMAAHDTVSVTGSFITPTGKVSYSTFNNSTCSGVAIPLGQPGDLYLGSAPPSEDVVQTSDGISFMAHYSGDLNYNSGDSLCEPLLFGKLDPVITPTLHDADHNPVTVLPIAKMVHDNALVTGSYLTPTGDVTFTLFNQKEDCTGPFSTQTLPLSNNGTVESTALRAPNTGLSYKVSYAGDINYYDAIGSCQPLDVTKLDPVMDFVFHDSGHNVITTAPTGAWVHVSATFSGDADTPTGTVNYSVYNNLTCAGNPADIQPVDLDDSGVAHSTTEMQVLASGLSYKVQYPGDANYKVVNSACLPLKMNTTTTLTPSKNPSIVGKLVTFTITVTSSAGPVAGQATLTIDGVPVQITLNSSGVGSYTTGMLTFGTHVMTARFAGDIAHNPSTSTELDENIIKENLYSPIVIGN